MTALLAIIAHDRADRVTAGDMQGLVMVYERLRGKGARTEIGVDEWARVTTVSHPSGHAAGVERAGDAWAAWAGNPAPGAIDPGVSPGALDGQFVLVRYDRAADHLSLFSDPLGLKPVFVAERSGRTYVSTSSLVLARHLGAAGLREETETFLRTGRQFGPDTSWVGVRRAEPALRTTFTATGIVRSRYWSPSVDERTGRLGLREAAATCASAAVTSVRETCELSPEPWCDLTGGFDSRLLALLLERAGLRFRVNTFGDQRSEDVRIAADVSATAGWHWSRYDLPDDWAEALPDRLEGAVAWGDAQLDALQLAEVLWGHEMKAEMSPVLYIGGGGELFSGFAWEQEFLRAGRTSEVNFDRMFTVSVLPAMDVSVFARDPTPDVVERGRRVLSARIEAYASEPNNVKLDILHAYKTRGHFGAYQAAAGGLIDARLPFFAKPVFTDAISVPPRFRRYHRLVRHMMHGLGPAVAGVRTTTGGPAEPLRLGNAPQFARYPWRRGLNFAWKAAGRSRRGSPAVAQIRGSARRVLLHRMVEGGRLEPSAMRSGRLYDPGGLERLVARAAREPASASWALLGRIITAEMALELVDAEIPA